ncbi:MAG: hypothetical protein S4CHLAM7_07390 [Chlamydiae bacterium]|nr:hypothetical protein [Chlamydiota bacterium]
MSMISRFNAFSNYYFPTEGSAIKALFVIGSGAMLAQSVSEVFSEFQEIKNQTKLCYPPQDNLACRSNLIVQGTYSLLSRFAFKAFVATNTYIYLLGLSKVIQVSFFSERAG